MNFFVFRRCTWRAILIIPGDFFPQRLRVQDIQQVSLTHSLHVPLYIMYTRTLNN